MAEKETDNPNERELKGKEPATAQEDANKARNSMSAARECRDTLELNAHAAADEGSPKVSQGANSGKSETPPLNSLRPKKDAHAGDKSKSNPKCFYCKKKLSRNDKGITCPDGPTRFDFRKDEPACSQCVAFLQRRYQDYISDCSKRFGRSQ